MSKCKSDITCLVTGAAGFLGFSIVDHVVSSGIRVRATDQRDDSPSQDIEYCRADILDRDSFKSTMAGMECVIHAAGLAHIFDRSRALEGPFKAINVTGTTNVAWAAAQAGVAHFLLISSVSVYGNDGAKMVSEDSHCNPKGPYPESKYQAEQRAVEIAEHSGMNLTILRLATAYGEGDPGNVSRLMKAIDRRRFILIGPGLNRKSLIHREDVGRACLAVLQNPPKGINIFNVSAPPCTMREVVEGLALALGRKIPPWHVPAPLALRIGSICKSFSRGRGTLGNLYDTVRKWLEEDVYDATKFEKTFNFKTKVGLTEGLNREVDWYRSNQRRHLG